MINNCTPYMHHQGPNKAWCKVAHKARVQQPLPRQSGGFCQLATHPDTAITLSKFVQAHKRPFEPVVLHTNLSFSLGIP